MDVGLIFVKSRSSQRIKQKNSPEDGSKINCDVSGGSRPMGGADGPEVGEGVDRMSGEAGCLPGTKGYVCV